MKSKPVILYVDDEEINLKIFELNFSKGYEVFISQTPFDGLKTLDKNKNISVVISDMRMPEMNGIEFINKARQKFPSIKYFLLTGFDITPEIELALEEGIISKYFQKPCNCEELKKEIE